MVIIFNFIDRCNLTTRLGAQSMHIVYFDLV